MRTEKIKATITMGENSNLTLRLWLTNDQRETMILEKGRCPIKFNIIIMDGGKSEFDKELDKAINKRMEEAEGQ